MTTTTACPNCHRPQSTQPPNPGNQSFQSRDTEIAYIQNETHRIDQLVAELMDQRAALLGRLNFIQSRTSTIPPETLSHIFQYLCLHHDSAVNLRSLSNKEPTRMDEHPLFILGAVCSHWRRLVRSTPHFWMSANLGIHPKELYKVPRRLQLFLEKSVNLPMNLSLHFPTYTSLGNDVLIHPTIDDLILENLPRIQSLRLINPSRNWLYMPDCLSQLTDFSVKHSALIEPAGELFLRNSPLLHHLTINGSFHTRYHVCWNALTKLDFSNVPIDICTEFLLRCSNLIEYDCEYPTPSSHAMDAMAEETQQSYSPDLVVKEHLKTFHWGSYPYPASKHILRTIRVPALKTLRWATYNRFGEPPPDEEGIFFANIPSILTTLEVSWNTTLLDIRPLLELPRIEHLTVNEVYTDAFFHILAPLDDVSWNDSSRCFPGLNQLTVQGEKLMEGEDPPDSYYVEKVIDMLVKRFDNPSAVRFRLELIDISPTWSDDVEEQRKDLVARGMELEIIPSRKPYRQKWSIDDYISQADR